MNNSEAHPKFPPKSQGTYECSDFMLRFTTSFNIPICLQGQFGRHGLSRDAGDPKKPKA